MQQISPLKKAVDYIENHLNQNINLSDVAKETGYSYYHMTRLFTSILGESAGHYINRRRLYNASKKLLHSDQRIIDIALESGFESPEAFSRAFKAVFGSSPSDYRKAGLDLSLIHISIGEPPPIPITKSAFCSRPKAAARATVSTDGFSSISSNRL